MADLETVVLSILADYKVHKTKDPEYRVTTSTRMLGWTKNVEVQQVTPDFWRIGAIGDGNCLVHSLLFAASPSYRQEGNKHRALIADKFREILNTRVDELKAIADVMYAEMGGWESLAESFDILKRYKRSEVNIELGPVIARLYRLNFLAVNIQGGELKPQVLTYNDGRFDPALPSVLINYRSWQILNLGGRSSSSSSGSSSSSEAGPVANHYEVIISGNPIPKPAAASSKKKTRRKKDVTYIFPPGTTYVFRPADPLLAPLLVEFERPIKEAKKEANALRIWARALNTINEARAATVAAGAAASSPQKRKSRTRSRSGSGSRTRKRSFASKSPSPAP
jgi:hypothetical protein